MIPNDINAYTTASDWRGTTTEEILARAKEAKAKFDAINERMLRRAAEIAEMQCEVCNRKVTVLSANHLIVCEHIYRAVADQLPKSESLCNPIFDPAAIVLEVFEDGPARF